MIHSQRAWLFKAQSSSLELSSKAVPALLSHQVLVKNTYIGINPVDWKFIAQNPLNWQTGHIPGVDGVGTVIAIGPEVQNVQIGQKVAYHTALGQDGSFAEYCVLNQYCLLRIPDTMTDALAAALPCPMLTAIQAFEKLPLRNGAPVLVAGMGSVHSILVQLLTRAGMVVDVLSASITDTQASLLGIRTVYRNISEISTTYYGAFDAVSGVHAQQLVPLLDANGHIICTQDRIPAPIDPAFTRTISYHEVALGALHTYGNTTAWQRLMHLGEQHLTEIVQKNIFVAVPTIFAFTEMAEALKHSETTKLKTVVALEM